MSHVRWVACCLIVGCADEAALPVATDASVMARRAALGRLLFYDPILSADGETACATCHSELWGMSDGLPRSIGLGGGTLTGPGRKGPNVLTRNAPSLWNVGSREATLLWDGSVGSLEEQALIPMNEPEELAKAPAEVVADLRPIPEYVTLFAAAFPENANPVTVANLQSALATFQRTLVSDQSLWEAWMAGDERALTAEQARGYEVFMASACGDCHVPPRFESATFARRLPLGADLGRMETTGREEDRGAFRTPSLRHARDTAPYFHDGSVATLDEAVHLEVLASNATVSAADEAAMVAFLGRALIDRSREPDRPDTVPSGLPVPEDGFRIPR